MARLSEDHTASTNLWPPRPRYYSFLASQEQSLRNRQQNLADAKQNISASHDHEEAFKRFTDASRQVDATQKHIREMSRNWERLCKTFGENVLAGPLEHVHSRKVQIDLIKLLNQCAGSWKEWKDGPPPDVSNIIHRVNHALCARLERISPHRRDPKDRSSSISAEDINNAIRLSDSNAVPRSQYEALGLVEFYGGLQPARFLYPARTPTHFQAQMHSINFTPPAPVPQAPTSVPTKRKMEIIDLTIDDDDDDDVEPLPKRPKTPHENRISGPSPVKSPSGPVQPKVFAKSIVEDSHSISKAHHQKTPSGAVSKEKLGYPEPCFPPDPLIKSSDSPHEEHSETSKVLLRPPFYSQETFKSVTRSREVKPYLSERYRRRLRNNDLRLAVDGEEPTEINKLLHVDFSPWEVQQVKAIAQSQLRSSSNTTGSDRHQLHHAIAASPEETLIQISHRSSKYLSRSTDAVKAFLEDVQQHTTKTRISGYNGLRARAAPEIQELDPALRPSSRRRIIRDNTLLARELGYTGCDRRLQISLESTIGPSLRFKGTSGDVNRVAWAPDSNRFAVGSIALDDEDSMQYNRPNNLLLGDVNQRQLLEIPDHCVPRQDARPTQGPNSTEEMNATQDPRLFKTISAVTFAPNGQLFSASYDKSVRQWDVDNLGSVVLDQFMRMTAEVDICEVNRDGLIAVGIKRTPKHSSAGKVKRTPIKVLKPGEAHLAKSFYSERSLEYPADRMYPSALDWCPEPGYTQYLLAGFNSNTDDAYNGHICLWDVETQMQQRILKNSCHGVLDCRWNPTLSRASGGLFAVASVARGKAFNKGTNTCVKLYDLRNQSYGIVREFECPAKDINDVVYCPWADNYVTAGCTDGSLYVWDARNPDKLLHKLSHGEPTTPSQPGKDRELWDTGVRFTAWDKNRLYSGSSDGVLKVWDITRSTVDALQRNIATFDSGIMAGAFSPDFSKLLIGEVDGTINVLEVGCHDRSARDAEVFKLTSTPFKGADDEESPLNPAQTLLDSNQISLKPIGGFPKRQAVQGPKYSGPYSTDPEAARQRQQAKLFQHEHKFQPGSGCDIRSCKEFTQPVTEEDDLVEYRWQYRTVKGFKDLRDSPRFVPVMGRKICASCGRLVHDKASESSKLCGICEFTCFRCTTVCEVDEAAVRVRCSQCQITWQGETLGWRLIEDGNRGLVARAEEKIPRSPMFQQETSGMVDSKEASSRTCLAPAVDWEDYLDTWALLRMGDETKREVLGEFAFSEAIGDPLARLKAFSFD